jgi:hypothetical protein
VCAIGLRVDDVPAALARAQALRINTYSQPVGTGEHAIPALRGVGGSLLYLVEAHNAAEIWSSEFEPVTGVTAQSDAGLIDIDHVSQVMPFEDMLSWLLFYGALFDLHKTPLVEVADPRGLVQTQAMESPDRLLRIVLNASAAQQTLSSRFLDKYMGAGVQHLTFRSNDIFESAARMRDLGVDLLPIPVNYYHDLESRFALKPGAQGWLRFTVGNEVRELPFGPLAKGDPTVDAHWASLAPASPAVDAVRAWLDQPAGERKADDPALTVELGQAIVERIGANQAVPPAERDEAAHLFVSLSEMRVSRNDRIPLARIAWASSSSRSF